MGVITGFTAYIDDFLKLLRSGAKNIAKAINDFVDGILKWLDELVNPKAAGALPLVVRPADEIAEGAVVVTKYLDDIKKIIDNVKKGKTKLKNRKMKANFGEMVSDYNFLSKQWTINGRTGTFKRISNETTKTLDDTIRKGIDGVYEFSSPPPRYVINEAKFGTSQLSRQATKSGGSQMTETWIEFHLRTSMNRSQAEEIILEGYESIVTRVNSNGLTSQKSLKPNAKIKSNTWP